MNSSSSSASSSDVEDVELDEVQHHSDSKVIDDLRDEEVMGDEELGIVSKYAKVNQPCPFSKTPPKYPIGLEWRNINYKVVIPLPPQNLFVKLLFKLPIPATITNYLKTKKEVPILNNVSGKVTPGSVVAIMGPTGSGKVPCVTPRPADPFAFRFLSLFLRFFPPIAFVLCSFTKR
jgi:ABC-type multidrug transport system fused ATPase/permease subunit